MPTAPTAPPRAIHPEHNPIPDGATVARALGDALRWRIVGLLAGEQLCVGHLAELLGAAQPLVSHHLKVLRAAGLVQAERYRYWTYYHLRTEALDALADQLWLLARTSPAATACRRLAPATHAPPRPAAHSRPSIRPSIRRAQPQPAPTVPPASSQAAQPARRRGGTIMGTVASSEEATLAGSKVEPFPSQRPQRTAQKDQSWSSQATSGS